MKIIVVKDNKEYLLNCDTLLSPTFEQELGLDTEETNTEEVTQVEVEDKTYPTYYKDKNVVFKKDKIKGNMNSGETYLIYNVEKTGVNIKYSGDTHYSVESHLKVFRDVREDITPREFIIERGESLFATPFFSMFKTNIMNTRERQLFVKYYMIKFKDLNYTSRVNLNHGVYLMSVFKNLSNSTFINPIEMEDIVQKRTNYFNTLLEFEHLRKSDRKVPLGNIFASRDICWGDYKTEFIKVVKSLEERHSTRDSSDITPISRYISSHFLSSVFNDDLNSVMTLKARTKYAIIREILAYDFSDYLNDTEAEILSRFIEDNSKTIETHITNYNVMSEKDVLFLATMFDIPYHELYY